MNYIFGDLHNNIEELEKLVLIINLKKEDKIFFIGDLIDKNRETKKTIEYLLDLKEQNKCIFIRGNHEFVWERYLINKEKKREDFILKYGGIESLKDFSQGERLFKERKINNLKDIFKDYLKLIEKMFPFQIVSNFLIMHSGLKESQLNKKPLKLKEFNYFLRPQEINKEKKYLGEYRIIAGHTFLSESPFFSKAYINIDGGAGYGKKLSAYCIEEKKVIRSDGKKFKDPY